MNTKFTSASIKDGNKVTLRLAQFDGSQDTDGVPRSLLHKDSILLVLIKANNKLYQIAFPVNRINSGVGITAATNSWPRELRQPKVGKPVTYEVVGVTYV